MSNTYPQRQKQRSAWRILLFFSILFCLTYLILELVFSAAYSAGLVFPPRTGWYFEASERTVHFDPIRGYSLGPTPSRFARITSGEIEYVGALKGNAQGFPDRDDFWTTRTHHEVQRIAVFGDSFTAAQFLERNWPDAAEDIAEAENRPLELLNFSVDGGGLANWWSVLKQIVDKDGYELDLVLFAVCCGDLQRSFSISEHRGYSQHMFTRTASWDPASWPKTEEQARAILSPIENSYILTREDFESVLNGSSHPALPRPYRPYFSLLLGDALRSLRQRLPFRAPPSPMNDEAEEEPFNSEQQKMIKEISEYIQRKSLRAVVVRIPSREDAIEQLPVPIDVARFSELIDAVLVDGATAFSGMTENTVRSMWLPYDGHWGQSGSDHFARFMLEMIYGVIDSPSNSQAR